MLALATNGYVKIGPLVVREVLNCSSVIVATSVLLRTVSGSVRGRGVPRSPPPSPCSNSNWLSVLAVWS